jgi:hypothetical protein
VGSFWLRWGCRTHWIGKGARRLPLLLSAFLASLTLLLASVPSASALPEKFFGLHWGGTSNQTAADMEAISHSGAKYYHLQLSRTSNVAAEYDQIFQLAWEQGITILPYLYSGGPTGGQFPTLEQLEAEGNGPGTWIWFVYDVVHRYGFQGDFWNGKSNPKPAPEWEIWNEPNLRDNNPGGVSVYPESYTRFARRMAIAVQAAQKEKTPGAGTRVNFGNLFSAATCKDGPTCEQGSNYKSMNVGLFLEKAKNVDPNGSNFTGLALHPYSFASGKQGVETNVKFARQKLNEFFGGSTKELWITELGWLAEGGDSGHPASGEEKQNQFLTESFNWIRSVQAEKNIQSLVYFNYHDFVAKKESEKWAEHAGLRRLDSSFRPAWYSFQAQTGAPTWPAPLQTRVSFDDAPNAHTVSTWTWDSFSGWQQMPFWGHQITPGSSPETLMDMGGTPHVFYVDELNNNTITDWKWSSGTGWQQEFFFGHSVAKGSSPSAIRVGGTLHVFFVDATNNSTITDWKWNSVTGWQQEYFYGHSVAAGTSPSAIVDSSGNPRVYFVDASNNNTITQWKWNSVTGWQQEFFWGHPVAAGSSPSAMVDSSGNPRVYFVDASYNQTITQWKWNSVTGWQQEFFWGHPVAAGSSPSAMMVNGIPEVFFVDAPNNNTITAWAWASSTGWLQYPFWGHPVATGSSPSAVMNGTTPNVYFVDAANLNSITDWQWNPSSGWQQIFLYGHEVAANSSPSGFSG